jgi:hypothetical protein
MIAALETIQDLGGNSLTRLAEFWKEWTSMLIPLVVIEN